MPGTLIAIDGNSLMHRAFHALPLLTNQKGEYTNAVFGFIRMLLKLLNEYKPEYVAVAFDMHGETFRHAEFAEYKATRSATPEELIGQFDMLKKLLDSMGIKTIECEGFEADDILGCLSKLAKSKGVDGYIVTGDKDALQLVGGGVKVILTRKGISETDILGPEGVKEFLGVPPERVPDLKGLMGDASDNIPGIPGVGPKTATELLKKYGDLETALENRENYGGPKLRELLVKYADQARLSKALATIRCELGKEIDFDSLVFKYPPLGQIKPTFEALGFVSLLKEFEDEKEAESYSEIKRNKIDDISELKAVLSKKAELFAVVLEEDRISIAFDQDAEYSAEFSKTLLNEGIDFKEAVEAVGSILSDESVRKILFDKKKLLHELSQFGITLCGRADDAMLAAYVVNPAMGQYSLLKLCQTYSVSNSACAASLIRLMAKLDKELDENDLRRIYDEIELPLCDVLFEMEKFGFTVDTNVLAELGRQYADSLADLEEKIYEAAGHKFNINSTKQLGTVLYEELGLKAPKKTKTGYSTDIEVLEQLFDEHRIIPYIIDYRKLSKLKSTYIDGLIQVADKNGRIHTTFKQNVTATGRISSVEPNLQNIPVKTQEGREIRRAFIASGEGRVLAAADYSQIELRVLAELAGEDTMRQIFNSGGDIHTITASEVFAVPREQVTSQMRSAAKAVNFGIVYGISDFGLSRNLGISRKEAARYINNYFARFPAIKTYMDGLINFAKTNGYVKTLWGRRRYTQEIQSPNFTVRSFGERIAMNAPIQGTAADIIKAAMIKTNKVLKERFPDAKLILQVHDELIVDCKSIEAPEVSKILKDCMENVLSLSVPLTAQSGCGRNWLEAK